MTLTRQMTFWVLTLAIGVAALWVLREILLPFVAGMALAYLLDPLANRLERMGVNRLVATLVIIGAVVLVFVILAFGKTPTEVGPLAVALLVVAIGASLGGPTGYAINPARDLGPRIMHALLPIRDKGSSGWHYAWVPVVAPIIGGVLAGLAGNAVGFV